MKKFEEFIKESNDYGVGDIVNILYWMTGDIAPVKIIKKVTKNNFIVSFNVENSHLCKASNQTIKKSAIIGMQTPVSEPVDSTSRYAEHPNIEPDVSGIMPGGDSMSNDISF